MLSTNLLPPEAAEDDPLLDAAAQLEQSAHALDLEDWIMQRLKHPDRETTVNIPLQQEAGATTCTAYRVQHLRAHRHCLGPVQLAPDTHVAELRAAALELTLQYALLDLPLGGSAGAIVCDPAHLTESQLRHAIRHYLAALDVRGDVYATAEYAAAWTSAARHLQGAALVGKPSSIGGVPDRASAIASGWMTLISQLSRSEVGTSACRVSIQGVGAAAMKLASTLQQAGAKVIGLADKSGGIFAQDGLDITMVSHYLAEHRMLYGFSGVDAVGNADVLESDCDVLFLAAAERQVSLHNAAKIKGKLVLEAVSGAITPAAASAVAERGVTVVPALLGTAPRALSWFAEWQSGLRYESPDQETTEAIIRRRVEVIVKQVNSFAAEREVSFADACRLLSLKKFAAVLRLLN